MEKQSFYYVYILQSKVGIDRFYTGFTENIENRLKDHKSGKDARTAKYKPWRIKTAIAFSDRNKALKFERYLKSPSGRAFAKKTSVKIRIPIKHTLGIPKILKPGFKHITMVNHATPPSTNHGI